MTHTNTAQPAPARRRATTVPTWWQPCGVDRERINLAYLYDAFREAKDSDGWLAPTVKFAHDNELDAALLLGTRVPDAGFVFRSEQAFLDRAATYLATRQRVSSIVVAGAGLPHIDGDDDLHSTVRRGEAISRNRAQSSARTTVIYVERDPLTLAQLRTIADPDDGVHVVDADPWDPDAMWNTLYNTASENPGLICSDFERVALLLGGGVMSFYGGSRAAAAQVVQTHLARLPAGSFVAMTHLFRPEHPGLAAQAQQFEYALQFLGLGAGCLATEAEIRAMIDGTTVLPTGIVPAFTWYPEGPPTGTPACGHFTAAVLAQKPFPHDDIPEPPRTPPPRPPDFLAVRGPLSRTAGDPAPAVLARTPAT
ncbi:SAM-dependent methyltransferase [Amycolatopsis sp. OK19-0408]|uniref:SAM-dependent methyltransferase n=1 Tax=Amycolatopsis iheyensis TaxID=2945988 RepID=A0A9X2SMY7_9PSEU|nr:SAM-dependent methyltransferase [Amycolatopsis iheyensis]MCR6488332.1 SAM-dependent methyltransferase [Amycolatopsis iheyensis]